MDANEHPISETLGSTAIPIAEISPDVELLSKSSIHAAVTLVWPYSSSTKSLSLLLAEPDFRLRRTQGQVKVVFHGHVAENVAKSQVGIGDHVYLGLTGARFVNNEAAIQTPGRCITWDVHFDDRVFLEIWRSSQHLSTVKIDPPSPLIQSTDDTAALPGTPIANGRSHLDGYPTVPGLGSWKSPAFLGRTRTSLVGLVDSALNPFAEEDGFVPGKGRKRPRFSMQGANWRVIDEPESPGEKEVPADWTWMFDEDQLAGSDIEDGVDSSTIPPETTEAINGAMEGVEMAVNMDNILPGVATQIPEICIEQTTEPDSQCLQPSVPKMKEISQTSRQGVSDIGTHLPTDTPHLHPIPSPGLPIPSPLDTTPSTTHGYFPPAIVSAPTTEMSPVAVEAHVEVTRSESKVVPGVQPAASRIATTEPVVSTSIEISEYAKSAPRFHDDGVHLKALDSTLIPSSPATNIQPDEVAHTVLHQVEDDKMSASIVGISTPEADKHLVDTGGSLGMLEAEEMERSDINTETGEIQDEDSFEGYEEESDNDDELGEIEEQQGEDVKQSFATKDSHAQDMAKVAESDVEETIENGEENMKDNAQFMAESGAHTPLERREARKEDYGHYIEDVEEGEEEDEEEDVMIVEEEEEEEEEEDSELEDGYEYEEMYDEEELEEEEGSEEMYGDGYVDSELESETSTGTPVQPQPTQKIVHPEVIVLDSDSEDEPPPKPQAHTRGLSLQEAARTQDLESPASSADEDSVYEESFVDSEVEDKQVEDELTEDEFIAHDPEGDEYMEDEPEEDEPEEDELEADKPLRDEHITDQTEIEQGAESLPSSDGYKEANSGFDDEVISRGDSEEIQATTADSHSPEQGIFGYDLSIAQSTQPSHTSFKPSPHDLDVAIDPELCQLGDHPDVPSTEAAPEQGRDDYQTETGVRKHPAIPTLRQEVDSGLFLDGTGSPRLMEMIPQIRAPSPQPQQLITPDASQVTGVNHHFPTDSPIGEILPTPEHTQEIPLSLASQYQAEIPPSDQTMVDVSVTSDEDEMYLVKEFQSDIQSPLAKRGQLSQIEEQFMPDDMQDLPSPPNEGHAQAKGLGRDGGFTLPAIIDRYYTGLRSKLSYFAPLATLVDHFHALVDTISIVSELSAVTRATSGKKDFMLTLQLTDPSMAGTTVCAQIFRPYKTALPYLKEGDAVLLRNFEVKSFNHSMMLVSVDTSAWAAFNDSSDEAQVAGPPVEYGMEEQAYATDLRQWYHENGMAMVADNQLQALVEMGSREATPFSSVARSDSGSVDSERREVREESSLSNRSSRRRKSHRRVTIHELRDGRRYLEVGSPSDKESIHELRDGTLYANL